MGRKWTEKTFLMRQADLNLINKLLSGLQAKLGGANGPDFHEVSVLFLQSDISLREVVDTPLNALYAADLANNINADLGDMVSAYELYWQIFKDRIDLDDNGRLQADVEYYDFTCNSDKSIKLTASMLTSLKAIQKGFSWVKRLYFAQYKVAEEHSLDHCAPILLEHLCDMMDLDGKIGSLQNKWVEVALSWSAEKRPLLETRDTFFTMAQVLNLNRSRLIASFLNFNLKRFQEYDSQKLGLAYDDYDRWYTLANQIEDFDVLRRALWDCLIQSTWHRAVPSYQVKNWLISLEEVLSLFDAYQRQMGRKDNRSARILLLGDAASVGSTAIEPSQRWVNRLGGLLKHNVSPEVDLINCSHASFTLEGCLKMIDLELSAYEPDMILIILGANDLYRNSPIQKMFNHLSLLLQKCRIHTPRIVWGVGLPETFPVSPERKFAYQNLIAQAKKELSLNVVELPRKWLAAPYIDQDGIQLKASVQGAVAKFTYDVIAPTVAKIVEERRLAVSGRLMLPLFAKKEAVASFKPNSPVIRSRSEPSALPHSARSVDQNFKATKKFSG